MAGPIPSTPKQLFESPYIAPPHPDGAGPFDTTTAWMHDAANHIAPLATARRAPASVAIELHQNYSSEQDAYAAYAEKLFRVIMKAVKAGDLTSLVRSGVQFTM